MNLIKVTGRDHGKVLIYALSTCGWCKKTKQFLKDNDVEFSYVDVDLLQREEREMIVQEIEKWNPSLSFPTIVINDSNCVIGFDEKKLREILKI